MQQYMSDACSNTCQMHAEQPSALLLRLTYELAVAVEAGNELRQART